MKRRTSERGISTEELASKQRIVRRKRRTPSPDLEDVPSKSHREVRTSGRSGLTASGGLYTSKYASKYEQRSHKTDSQIREERLGTKYDTYETAGSFHRSPPQTQDPRTERHGGSGGGHHQSPLQHNYVGGQGDKFDYSLRVGNLEFKMADAELKKALFNKYKKYGYVNIKLLGMGKERHAFINFSRENDARTALESTQDLKFLGHIMDVNWSRSTLNRFPDLLSGVHNESRTTVLNAKRRLLGPPTTGSGCGESQSSSPVRRGVTYKEDFRSPPREREHSRTTRDISYRTTTSTSTGSVSPPPLPHPHERGGSESGRHTPPPKSIPTIVDSNATRTLFVGNLEYDITERELRDLFGPYGRIESVDIKSQRSSDSAYSFVKFFTITDAINAKNDIHGRQYGNYRLKIGFGKGNPSIKVWIGNISCYADVSEIRQELDRFGLIRKIEYVKGDNHAMVHFDSMDAAQMAVNSLQDYRFRSTNRPLKIDIMSKSLTGRGSDFDDFEIEVISPTSSRLESRWSSSKTGKSGSAELSSSSGNYRRRITREDSRGREEVRERGDSHRYHERDVVSRNGRSSLYPSGSGGGGGGGRIVSESGSRSLERRRGGDGGGFSSSRNSGYEKFDRGEHGDGTNFRKRARSPSMNHEDHFNSSTGHYSRRHSTGDGGGDMGGGSFNGGSDYRSKKPRNSFDAYKYHKLYGNRSDDRVGGSRFGSDKDKNHSDLAGDSREREHREERIRERDRRDRTARDDSRRDSGDKKDMKIKDEKKDTDVKKSGTEATPKDPPPQVLISNDTADTALKLSNPSDTSSLNGVTSNSNLTANSAVTISDLAKLFPIAWKGTLVLKNTGFPTRMHLIGGDPTVVELLIRSKEGKDEISSLRITQRLRLEPPRLEEVNKRMASAGPSGHCILLALAGPTPSQSSGDDNKSDSGSMDTNTQLRPLKSLVSYLKQKEAAGIVALNGAEKTSVTSMNDEKEKDNVIGVLHAFPPCDFSQKQLLKIAPHLGEDTSKEDHIVVLLVKGTV